MENQIKLVVADMDGTILNDHKVPPHDLPEVIEALSKQGVVFCAASGRQRYNVECKLKDVKTPFVTMGDNSAVIDYFGKRIYGKAIGRDVLKAVAELVRQYPDMDLCCSGPENAYYEHDCERVNTTLAEYYDNLILLDDVTTMPEEPFKITIMDFVNPKERGLPLIRPLAPGYEVVLSGDPWIDINPFGISKGEGVRKLMNEMGISADQVMAFGDNFNDETMLRLAGESYAMANAPEGIKAICRHIAPSCNEEGVTRVLKEVFSLGEETNEN